MKGNPLLKITKLGQSIWLDFLDHEVIHSGKLRRWIQEDGLSGVTSNPEIFKRAIDGSDDYTDAIRSLALRGQSAEQIYESIAVEDIKHAADVFRSTYEQTHGRDGLISLVVSPYLAHDTLSTIEEARRLWATVSRPNLLIQVPATQRGLAAIQQLVSEGINVNAALVFGLPRYRKVAEAYVAGLQARAAQKKALEHVASVASFLVSRIDVWVDPKLQELAQDGGPNASLARRLKGQTAIASAKMAFQLHEDIFGGEHFRKLAHKGARAQRLLWASTSTKKPNDSDVKYVEALIGPHTVNTLPMETLDAYRDHGSPAPRLIQGLEEAHRVLQDLAKLGLDLDQVGQQLEDEGVENLKSAYDKLIAALNAKREAVLGQSPDRQPVTKAGPRNAPGRP
jgi:transaldolase